MKNIGRILINDLRAISKNIIAFIVVIGISVLPALYSWFNIASNWDPYSNTGGIDFAVCSLDKGFTYSSLTINAGDEIISNLKQNDKMGWDFVGKKEALEGVKNGKYYAAVIIPENFSENLCSITTGEFNRAELQYYVNDKKNAIAPKLTNAGVQTIQNQISATYVSTITEVIATTLNLTSSAIGSEKSTTADKVSEALDELQGEIDTFNAGIDVFSSTIDNLVILVKDNKEILPDISDTLSSSGVITGDVKSSINATKNASKNVTDSIANMIASVESAQSNIGTQIDALFDRVSGDIAGFADEIDHAADSVGEIQTTNQKLIQFLTDVQDYDIDTSEAIEAFNALNDTQAKLKEKLNTAAETLRTNGTLPIETVDEIKSLVDESKKEAETVQTALKDIESSLSDLSSTVKTVQQNIDKQTEAAFTKIESDANGAADDLAKVTELNQKIISADNAMIFALNFVQSITGIDNSSLVGKLEEINTKQQQTIDKINSACDTIRETGALPSDVQNEIRTLVNECETEFTGIESSLSQIQTSFSNAAGTFSKTIENAESGIASMAESVSGDMNSAADDLESAAKTSDRVTSINHTIISFLKNTQENFGVDNSDIISKLEAINSDSGTLSSKLKNAAQTVRQTGELPDDIQNEINSLSAKIKGEISSLKTSFSKVKSSIDKAIDDVYGTLEKASGLLKSVDGDIPDLNNTLDGAIESLQQVKTTFNKVKTLMGKYSRNLNTLKDKIKELKEDSTIENYVSTIIERPDALGNFVANPVDLKTEELFKVENYGSAMAPFYTTLGFWVGSLILAAVIKTDLTKREFKLLDRPNATQLYFGRLLLFLMISQIQAIIISLGDIYFLGIQCENVPLFVVSAMISSLVYVLITYSLTITFSVIGKAISVIILVIQVAGSGGTFPIEVLPEAFQALAPFLPFKYSINMMREAVCGVDWSSYTINLLCLLAFVPFALILGLFLRKPCIKLMSFFNHRLEESGLIV